MKNSLFSIHETLLQKATYRMFIDLHDKTFILESGKRLQILSIGEHNNNDGPDFLNICMLVDGKLVVGDAELHKKSSDWIHHAHSKNEAYKSVKLHIVMDYDKHIDEDFEVLVLDKKLLTKYLKCIPQETHYDYYSLEEFQEYALYRLLRRTINIYSLLEIADLKTALLHGVSNYLNKYIERKRRPVYNEFQLTDLINNISNSRILFDFLQSVRSKTSKSIYNDLNNLLENKIHNEGYHLRLEIILNSILPIVFCLSDTQYKSDTLLWYWSKTSNCQYRKLQKKYPLVPQNYLWQQQGMLEYAKEFGNRTDSKQADFLHNYSFPEYISYYSLSKPPFTHIS